jgi:hypothetical protein
MNELKLQNLTRILAGTPPLLTALLKDLPDDLLFANEGSGTWRPFDVIGHLIHGEKTDWIPRTRIILEHGEARPFDPFDREAMLQVSKGKSIVLLLAEFAELRQESLRDLEALRLTEADLNRTGRHPALGVVTVGQHLSSWGVHDLDHTVQILRTIAKSTGNVGPWKEYLSVLSDRT